MCLSDALNLFLGICIITLAGINIYLMLFELKKGAVPIAFRWFYTIKIVIMMGWAGLFIYAATLPHFVLPSQVGAWFVRPGLISTLTIIMIGRLLRREQLKK